MMDYRYVGQAGAPASPVWGIASAFILLVADRWILFTAGHVIQDLKSKMSQGAQIDKWRLNDGLAGSRHLSVPFDPELEKWHVIYDEERGIDLAFTELRPFYAQQLYAGGITPAGSDWWFDGLPHECSTWLIFGTPDESVRHRPDGGAIANPALIPGDPIAEVPKNVLATGAKLGANLVYAKVGEIPRTPGGIVVTNLDGMSGGPVIGVRDLDDPAATHCALHIIGIQSGWLPNSRIATIFPLRGVLEVIAANLSRGVPT